MKVLLHVKARLGQALSIAVAASCLGVPNFSALAAEAQPEAVSRALDVQPLQPSEYQMLKHRKLLFATSRKISQNAQSAARSKAGGSYRYEDVFQETISPSIAYGWVEVGFPSDREFGAQNYNDDPANPNPFKYFSIEAYGVVGTRQSARELATAQGYDPTQRAFVFVHGINNSFSDAAERLTQLVVDLNVKGVPLLFSWPSETGAPVIRVTPGAYIRVLSHARASEQYFAQAIDDVLGSHEYTFDLLAHSMGTLVAFDVLSSRPSKDVRSLDPVAPAAHVLPNVVLAAPDIGMNYFTLRRDEFIRKSQRLTIYCGPDRALNFSKDVNGEERLGYCQEPKQQKDYIDGVEFVRLYGNFRDFWRHSYYLNSPQVLSDLKNALSMGSEVPASLPASHPPYREILLNN